MYEVSVRSRFSAAHSLRRYKGKCEKLHGHNWTVEASVASEGLNTQGMAIDFTILKRSLDAVLADLDHAYLNEIGYFKKVNPSSENIAKFIYDRLKDRLKKGAKASKVLVWETENSSALYRED